MAGHKIFKVIDRKVKIDVTDTTTKPDINASGGAVAIEFRNVNFAYPSKSHVQVLDNFSLSIPAGKTVALVGPSGCGKSTVVSLLQRFYDPTSGNIEVAGTDVGAVNVRSLRAMMGLVAQEPVLFGTSVEGELQWCAVWGSSRGFSYTHLCWCKQRTFSTALLGGR